MKKLFILTIILFTIQFLAPIFAQNMQKPRLVVQTGHTNSVRSITFSPNGKILASGSSDHTIKLWNLASGVELKTLSGHTESVTTITFSPNGQTIASGSFDKTIKLWNVATGQIITTLLGHTEYIDSVAFSPDGKIIASAGEDKTIKLWDVTSGQQIKAIGNSSTVYPIAFSPDGKTIASVGIWNSEFVTNYRTLIKLWDVDSGKELKTFKGHNRAIETIIFSPDGKNIITGSRDNTIKIWDAETGLELKTLTGHTSVVYSLAISPDGKTIASGGYDKTIKLWNISTGKELRNLTGHTSYVNSVTFSPDGKLIASGCYDNTIKLWDVSSGQETKTFSGHVSDIYSIAVSSDGKFLATSSGGDMTNSSDNTIKIWDISTGELLEVLSENIYGIESLTFSPDNKILASSGMDNTITLWDVTSGKEFKSFKGYKRYIEKITFSPDIAMLALGSEDDNIYLLNANSGQVINILKGHDGDVISIAFSPDGRTIASGSRDTTIKLWDTISGKELKTLAGHIKDVYSVAFSPDGKIIASGSWDNTIGLWSIESGQLIEVFLRDSPQTIEKVFPIVPGYYLNDIYEPLTANGKVQIKRGQNGRLNLYEVKTDKLLVSLISINIKDWIVITPDGRFDSNKLANPQGLHWIMPDAPFTPLSFEVFMRDYFEPKLLPRLLKCTEDDNCDEEFKLVRDLTSLNRTQPKVKIKQIKPTESSDTVEVLVETENVVSEFQKDKNGKTLDSGVFDLRLFRNGQMVGNSTSDADLQKTFRSFKNFDEELKVWREANRVELKDGKKTFSFRVKLPNDAPEKQIEFSAYAFNDDRVKSETSRMTYAVPKDAKLQKKPRRAYVLMFGVNRYDNPAWDLQFAGNDARAMRRTVGGKLRETGEFEETVEIPLISDDETGGGATIRKRDATKANVRTVFEMLSGKTVSAESLKNLETAIGREILNKIKPANPDDLVLISFSSHGYADKNGIFYILPSDIGSDAESTVSEKMLSRFISSDELSLWLREVDAGEMVMIVDACYAASFTGKDFKPAPMGSRGLGQLAFDKGMKILSATQAANVAIETGGSIGHGLLTYALLKEGLEKLEADFKAKDKKINLKEWLEFAEYRVPNLYEELKSGKFKFVGKGVETFDLGVKKEEKYDSTQRPSLFDFTDKPKEFELAILP